MRFDCRKFIRYVDAMSKAEDDREIDKEDNASNARHALRAYIDAKSAESNFSDLTKFCQRIRSISMRKDQIFSTLFVLLDRVFILQDRVCNICIVRFSEAILCDFIEFRICNDIIQYASRSDTA